MMIRATPSDARGMSLLEILIAFSILLIAVLTMVGYVATIHRASNESKRQAEASVEARAFLEQVRDSKADFELAASSSGLQTTRTQYLVDTEADDSKNEKGHEAAAVYQLDARAAHLAGDFYSVVVRADWQEDGRPRKVVLESRALRPGQ